MDHPAARIRFPEAIRPKTVEFFNWYVNDLCAPSRPVLHADNGEFEYDWRPRQGLSRLTIGHLETGLIAVNAFDFTRLDQTRAAAMPPPPSLLIATWLDLCVALGWLGESERAVLADQMNPTVADDTYRYGEPVFS